MESTTLVLSYLSYPQTSTTPSKDAHSAHMSNEWTAEETQLALYHDGLSRTFALIGLSHLSTKHSSIFYDTLSGKRSNHKSRPITLDVNNLSNSQSIDDEEEGKRDSLGVLPSWNQIHNRRCPNCDNALFLSINCSVSSSNRRKGQLQCKVCKVYLEREEPNKEVKRLYRSIRIRQNKKREEQIRNESDEIVKDVNGKAAKRDEIKEDDSDERSSHQQETSSKDNHKPKTLLQQRAAELKRKSKEKKKVNDEKGHLNEQVKQVQSSAISSPSQKVPQDIKIPRKRKQQSSSKQDETLRQMLAEKRAKRQEQTSSSQVEKGGLQDFLSSL